MYNIHVPQTKVTRKRLTKILPIRKVVVLGDVNNKTLPGGVTHYY